MRGANVLSISTEQTVGNIKSDIEFDDYFETVDQDPYNDEEEASIGVDFATLHPKDNNL